jgi:hypothetical protein
MEANLQDECRKAQGQLRVALALSHIDEMAELAQGDREAKAVALALVNQMITLGHLDASTAAPYLKRIHSLGTAT